MSDIVNNLYKYHKPEKSDKIEERRLFDNDILNIIDNLPAKIHNTFNTKEGKDKLAKDYVSYGNNALNQFGFGIPEAVLRATKGNDAADSVYATNDSAASLGKTAGTVASVGNPVGNVTGGLLKGGKILSTGAKEGISALLKAAESSPSAAKTATAAASTAPRAFAVNAIDATIQEAAREAATGKTDWGNVLLTGGVSGLTGGIMRKLTPKASPVDEDLLQASAEQTVATRGPMSQVEAAAKDPRKGGSKHATAADVASHIGDQAKFMTDMDIQPGRAGVKKVDALIAQYQEQMSQVLGKIKDQSQVREGILPLRELAEMRTKMAYGMGNPDDVINLQKGIDNTYKDIMGSPSLDIMYKKINDIMDKTSSGAAVGAYSDKAAFTLASMARKNLFKNLKEIDPNAAEIFQNYGKAREVDRQLERQMIQNINTPAGSNTTAKQGFGKLSRGDFIGGVTDLVGSNVGGKVDAQIRTSQKLAKANKFPELLKQQARSESPAAQIAETALVNKLPPVVGALATEPSQQAPQAPQDQYNDEAPGAIGSAYDDETQKRLFENMKAAITRNWELSGKNEAGGGEATLSNPAFAKYAKNNLSMVQDPDGKINPQKVGGVINVQAKDAENFENGFKSWQLIEPNIEKALEGTFPLGGIEKTNLGSNAGAWASSLNSKYATGGDVKTARQNLIDGFNLLAQSAGGQPGVAGDTAERLLSQATSLEDAKEKLLGLMKQINPSSYRTMQLTGILP